MSDKDIVKEVIDAFYKEAGFQGGWRGTVNESVASVFGQMLEASIQCSAALQWVPKPTGKATISWIVRYLGRSFVRDIQGKRAFICSQRAVYNFKTKLDMASMGL
jgi:selenophosphate synthetase-related protein